MQIQGPAKVVQVFVGESDRWLGKPLYTSLVELAREKGLAGATVTRGVMGFGANSRIHTAAILRLSEDLPMVVTIIDGKERIDSFLPLLQEWVAGGLVVSWDVEVLHYQGERKAGLGARD